MLSKILNNHILPVTPKNIRFGHIFIFFLIILIVLIHFALTPVEASVDDLYLSAREGFKQTINEGNTYETNFNMRSNNLWVNLIYYKQYTQALKQFFGIQSGKLPKPIYPLISVKLKPYFDGKQVLPPLNFLEIATFLRKTLGSGITIRTKNKLIGRQKIENKNNQQVIELLESYEEHLNKYFRLVVEGSFKKKPYKKEYLVNFKDFPQVSHDLRLLLLSKSKVKIKTAKLYENEDVVEFLNPDLKIKEEASKSKDNKEKPLQAKKPEVSKPIYTEDFIAMDNNEILDAFHDLRNRMAYIYTIELKGKKKNKEFVKKFIVKFENFPRFNKLLKKAVYNGVQFTGINLYQSKVLKMKANSREFVDFSQLPAKVRKAFVLVEDDYFYFQAGAIDPIGLTQATYNFLKYGTKKGNASILEQVYEMYLGSQRKKPIQKLYQILGTVLISYYVEDRTPYVNMYVQSIPGSYWRDHNYGAKGIIKNYLNKDSIKDLTTRELAWLTRIALLPNTYGQDYIRFYLIRQRLKELKVDIFNLKQVKEFLKKNSEEDKAFIRLPKEKNRTDFEVLMGLTNSYRQTNDRINKALKEFSKGNETMPPLITQKEYEEALKDEIQFSPSALLNQYQVYTDQTRKDLYRFRTVENLKLDKYEIEVDYQNASLDLEVAFDERAQNILEDELRHSTRIVYQFRYNPTEYKRYGGAAVLIRTNSIVDGSIENKIVAIASKHTTKDYFNWAVDGYRHFGSIYKWIALLLYLDNDGTLLDTFYDIPRAIKYKGLDEDGKVVLDSKGEPKYDIYRPDNWRLNRDDIYGYFTYEKHHNIYNFIQSKNNTFVKIAEIVGIDKLADFLNELAELKEVKPRNRFQARYPIVLGSQELSSIKFAQITSVIANRGIFKPVSTITHLIDPDGIRHPLILTERQVVSREASEAAFFCGFVNTFYGTAKRFITGGVGKTGSSDTDVSFLAMTARTPDQVIKDDIDHLLNSNLLYLVNVGVNIGKIDEGLFGGTVGAKNSFEVFQELLEYRYVKGKKVPKYKISGDFTKYFSQKFKYAPVPTLLKINGKTVKAPILSSRPITEEETLPEEMIMEIRSDYETRMEELRGDPFLAEEAQELGISVEELLRRRRQELNQLEKMEGSGLVSDNYDNNERVVIERTDSNVEDDYFRELERSEERPRRSRRTTRSNNSNLSEEERIIREIEQDEIDPFLRDQN